MIEDATEFWGGYQSTSFVGSRHLLWMLLVRVINLCCFRVEFEQVETGVGDSVAAIS